MQETCTSELGKSAVCFSQHQIAQMRSAMKSRLSNRGHNCVALRRVRTTRT